MENAAIDHISLLMALTPAGSRCLRGDKGGGNWLCWCTQLLKEDFFFPGFLVEDKFKVWLH